MPMNGVIANKKRRTLWITACCLAVLVGFLEQGVPSTWKSWQALGDVRAVVIESGYKEVDSGRYEWNGDGKLIAAFDAGEEHESILTQIAIDQLPDSTRGHPDRQGMPHSPNWVFIDVGDSFLIVSWSELGRDGHALAPSSRSWLAGARVPKYDLLTVTRQSKSAFQ